MGSLETRLSCDRQQRGHGREHRAVTKSWREDESGGRRAWSIRDDIKGISRKPESGIPNFSTLQKCYCTGKHHEAKQRSEGTSCCIPPTPGQRGHRRRCFRGSSELHRCTRQWCSPGSATHSHHACCLLSQRGSTCTPCTQTRTLGQLKQVCRKDLLVEVPVWSCRNNPFQRDARAEEAPRSMSLRKTTTAASPHHTTTGEAKARVGGGHRGCCTITEGQTL